MARADEIGKQELCNLVVSAFSQARGKFLSRGAAGDGKKQSKVWVETLAASLRKRYPKARAFRVFDRGSPKNRAEFGLNELLHDICVIRVGSVRSPKHKKNLLFPDDVLWQIESELKGDTRKALDDFNKLILGSARQKLFVARQWDDNAAFMEMLQHPAQRCSGMLFVALIPDPSRWTKSTPRIDIWKLVSGEWLLLASEVLRKP